MNVIYPVILSGGSGTRLWPLSRAMYPKQFIRVFNDQGSSLLATTLRRLASDRRLRPAHRSSATTTTGSWSRRMPNAPA